MNIIQLLSKTSKAGAKYAALIGANRGIQRQITNINQCKDCEVLKFEITFSDGEHLFTANSQTWTEVERQLQEKRKDAEHLKYMELTTPNYEDFYFGIRS